MSTFVVDNTTTNTPPSTPVSSIDKDTLFKLVSISESEDTSIVTTNYDHLVQNQNRKNTLLLSLLYEKYGHLDMKTQELPDIQGKDISVKDVLSVRKILKSFRDLNYRNDMIISEKVKLLVQNTRQLIEDNKYNCDIPIKQYLSPYVLERKSDLFIDPFANLNIITKTSSTIPKINNNILPDNKLFLQNKSSIEQQTIGIFHSEFLSQIREKYTNFKEIHANQIKTLAILAKQAMQYLTAHQKREKKDRIRALKENDMDSYLKMLKEKTDTRLESLLSQTDEFLQNLTTLVKLEQQKVSKLTESVPEVEGGDAYSNYYNLVHGLNEKITTQPKILTGGELKHYQLEGLEWMISLYKSNLNGILADEMGLGKTIQAIALFAYLYEVKQVTGPFLVVVPLSTLSNWTKEFKQWAPSLKVISYYGRQAERTALWQEHVKSRDFNVLITTYDYLIHKHERPRLGSIKWCYIVVDEGHRMKNTESKLAVTLQKHYQSSHRIILTGTPLQNNLNELWALFNFLLPTIFNSAENFDSWFNKPFENAGIENVDIKEEEKLLIIHRLHQVLRPFILRRLKSDVAGQLPQKMEYVLKCQLSAWQKVLYNQISQKIICQFDPVTGKPLMRGMNHTLMQLRKCCNHPYIFNNSINYNWDNHIVSEEIYRCSGKFELLDRLLPKLKKSGHRVLLFSQMTQLLDIMEDYLEWRNFQFMRLDGSTKAEDRSDLLKEFNAPDSPYFIFLLSTRAGGLGLNLQTADTVIIFDSDWNPQMDVQAQDRAHRIGQQNEVKVLRLCTTTPVEELILERAAFKLSMDSLIIKAGNFNNKDENNSNIAMDFDADENVEEDSDEKRKAQLIEVIRKGVQMGEEIDTISDDQLNELLARSEDEFEKFQLMDEMRNLIEMERYKHSLTSKDTFDFEKFDMEYEKMTSDEIQIIKQKLQDEIDGLNKDESIYSFPRLMIEEELPDYLKVAPEELLEKQKAQYEYSEDVFGRGKREKTQIDYFNAEDGTNLEDWMNEGGLKKRKRGRPSRSNHTDDEADFGEDVKKSKSNDGTIVLKQKKEDIHEEIIDILDKIEKKLDILDDPKWEMFRELPDEDENPNYFIMVEDPTVWGDIRNRAIHHGYDTVRDFLGDFFLLCSNVQTVNKPNTMEHNAAIELRDYVIKSCKKILN